MSSYLADMADNPFLLPGLVAGLLASLACGLVGPWVVTRRIVFLSGALAHIALGGIGAAVFLAYRFPGAFGDLDPLAGAIAVSVLSALLLAWVGHRAAERVDTLIGALWALGMSVGILLVKLTPGYQTELMSYLFGNLVFVSWRDVLWLVALDAVILATAVLFHKRFLALALDQEQATLQGVGPAANDAVLLALVALAVITLTRIVGLILVIALISLPAAMATRLAARLPGAVLVATGLSALVVTLPRLAVYGTGISPEPAIVLVAATLYVATTLLGRGRHAR
jgi:zinc transport system permease protein